MSGCKVKIKLVLWDFIKKNLAESSFPGFT